ncbi:MAG: hypothetical protein OER21_07800 [Gemmatimonadota bacterium]|nr:hypothetical protein [Gemmatimonadota bacterium]
MIPTRWRTLFEDQLADAGQKLDLAERQLRDGEGGRALQGAYQAVVGAASVRVWLGDPPWRQTLSADEMQRRAQAEFPNLFAALAALDLTDVLTSPWTAAAAAPYVSESRAFVAETSERLHQWLAES